jgi:Uma2 family endonuclease
MEARVLRRLFAVDEFHRMAEAGVFGDADRLELVDGEVVQMTPIGSRHAGCVMSLNDWFGQHVQARAIVSVQNPVVLSEQTEVYPDIALLKRRSDFYSHSLPRPADVLLIVEVADTTADYDRQVKLPRYARVGIPEVWVLDLPQGAIDVYRQPAGAAYTEHQRLGPGASVPIPGPSDDRLSVKEALG